MEAERKLKAKASLKNENNRVKQNRNYNTLHTRSHVKMSLSAITQLRKPDSLQLKMMLFLRWEPSYAALPPSSNVLLQKY